MHHRADYRASGRDDNISSGSLNLFEISEWRVSPNSGACGQSGAVGRHRVLTAACAPIETSGQRSEFPKADILLRDADARQWRMQSVLATSGPTLTLCQRTRYGKETFSGPGQVRSVLSRGGGASSGTLLRGLCWERRIAGCWKTSDIAQPLFHHRSAAQPRPRGHCRLQDLVRCRNPRMCPVGNFACRRRTGIVILTLARLFKLSLYLLR